MEGIVTQIKAHCPTCGDQMLTNEQVTLVLYPRRSVLNFYHFICGGCGDLVQKELTLLDTAKLRLADCNVEEIHLPAEAMEERPLMAALTNDDILDFMLDIEQEEYPGALA